MKNKVRVFAKTLVQTKPGVEKEAYLKQFAAHALSAAPNPLYHTEIELDSKEVQSAPQNFAGKLLLDSELASSIILVPASKEPEVKFDDLQPEVKRVYESYPLVEGERISSIKMLCLKSEWEGMARSTLFFERETNLSRIYFAVPRFRVDPQTPGLTPALLLGFDSVPVPRGTTVARIGSHNRKALVQGSNDDDSMDDLAQNIFSLALETISTLSWATPAGPFVSAGISIFQAIFGPKQDLIGSMHKIADDVVERIEYFQENQKLKDQLNALKRFSTWMANVDIQLNVQDPETFNNALTEPSGILSSLLDATRSAPDNLLDLTVELSEDDDLKKGDAYNSRHRWSLAHYKLHLLFLATSHYLMAFKFRIALLAKLDQLRYNAHGKKMEPWESNSDNTFEVLRNEMNRFKNELPKIIEIVKARRAGMVVLEDDYTDAAISLAARAHSDSPDWGYGMTKHDAIYWGYNEDQFVRGFEDHPTVQEFDWDWTYEKTERYVKPHPWRRTEIRDKAIYKGNQGPQDWILLPAHWGQGGYYSNTERAEALKNEYISGMLKRFDEAVKIPDILEASLTSLLDKWKPQIPMNLPADVKLDILQWDGKASEGDLWLDKTIMVRYLFSLRSVAGNESAKSNDVTSTDWYAPNGNCRPVITGLPTKGEYLEHVHSICLYRQFKKQLKDGTEKLGEARRVKNILRAKGQDEFPGQMVDKAPTTYDQV